MENARPPQSRIFSALLKKLAPWMAGVALGAGSLLAEEVPTAEKFVCLSLVVKNDANTIWRCLECAQDVADCISIVDAGSTDLTLEIVQKFIDHTLIPGRIYKHNWENAGQIHTLAAQSAKITLKELQFPLAKSYLLTLNPDMLLKVGPGFNKELLSADSYSVLEKSNAHPYYNYIPHLLRASVAWQSIGTTHDYWSCRVSYSSEKLPSLTIEENVTNPNQVQDDCKALEQALQLEPDNSRYMRLLAQTYQRLEKYDKAKELYFSSLQKEGNKEEAWFSKYKLGECYEKLGEWTHALYWYLDAYQYNPGRAESLLNIATHYRLSGQNDLAYIFAKHGARIPFPSDQTYYLQPDLYNYKFDEELSIIAYYTRFKNEGNAAGNEVVLRRNVPWGIKGQTKRNLLYYMENLKNARYQPIEIEFPCIHPGSEARYNPMNPSIQRTEEGYNVICRAVNYTQKGAKQFDTIDPSGVFRTKNFLVRYDKNFKLLSQREIIEDLPRERIRAFNIEGLEDCRIFGFGKDICFTCTTVDTNPVGIHEISLCTLEQQDDGEIIEVETLVPLQGPDRYRCEKNWLPFVKDGAIHAVYSYDPFTIYRVNPYTGECETVVKYTPAYDFSGFRGSAGPIEFDGGYLILVHDVVLLEDQSRCYTHQFLFLDKEFSPKKISKSFTFQHQGVEYSTSMTLDHAHENLILAVGIEDREAHLCFVDLETVRSQLQPLPPIVDFTFQHTQ